METEETIQTTVRIKKETLKNIKIMAAQNELNIKQFFEKVFKYMKGLEQKKLSEILK